MYRFIFPVTVSMYCSYANMSLDHKNDLLVATLRPSTVYSTTNQLSVNLVYTQQTQIQSIFMITGNYLFEMSSSVSIIQ